MFAHRPAPIQEMRERLLEEFMEQDEQHLWEEGKLVHGQMGVGSGATTVHILGYYGWSGARQGQQPAKNNNERGIRQLFKLAAQLGPKVPVVVLGDFNDEAATSEALQEVLDSGEWTDAAALAASKRNPPRRPQLSSQ